MFVFSPMAASGGGGGGRQDCRPGYIYITYSSALAAARLQLIGLRGMSCHLTIAFVFSADMDPC